MKILRSIFLIINWKTLLITILSLIFTYVCHMNNFKAEFPLSLVSVAIVFPIVFSINSAYRRREECLKYLADMKAHGMAVYFASRDWMGVQPELPEKVKEMNRRVFMGIHDMFVSKNEKNVFEKEILVHATFSEYSKLIQTYRDAGLNTSEISRVNQFLSKMMISFDAMKTVFHYRTPITLRAYSKAFIYSFPFFFGPFFAHTFDEYNPGWLCYIMPILFSFILVSLDNIQDHLEDPFDQVGEDDIQINTEDYMKLFHE